MKKTLSMLLILSVLFLTGCRARITSSRVTGGDGQQDISISRARNAGDGTRDNGSLADGIDSPTADDDPSSARATENPGADHREYDDSASGQVIPGARHSLQTQGDGEAGHNEGSADGPSVDTLDDGASRTARQNVPADEAQELATDDMATAADSCLVYYTVLLKERVSSLFECQRRTLYFELQEPFLTVHKSSSHHQLILKAGCYDVASRLLEQNLTVDAGWVRRKDPGVIVKVVSRNVLGFGHMDTSAAHQVLQQLLARPEWNGIDAVKHGRVVVISEDLLSTAHMQTAALLIMAKTGMPDLFADIDLQEALNALSQEALGAPAEGCFFYTAN